MMVRSPAWRTDPIPDRAPPPPPKRTKKTLAIDRSAAMLSVKMPSESTPEGTVLLVEQNANAALAIADHGYVMESGRVVFSGKAAELLSHPDVREFYLGGVSKSEAKNYRDIKQYRSKRRWWG